MQIAEPGVSLLTFTFSPAWIATLKGQVTHANLAGS